MRLLLLLCLCLLCLNLASLVPPASAGSAPAPSAPSSAPAPATAQQGQEELLQNWSLVSTIVPAPPSAVAFARPTSVAEVQAVVADATGKFPSPVLTVGSGHSSGDVVSVVESDGAFRGTILQMTEIKGMALEEVEVVAGGTAAGRRRRLRSGSGSSGSLRRRRLEGAAATATAEKKYYVRVGGERERERRGR